MYKQFNIYHKVSIMQLNHINNILKYYAIIKYAKKMASMIKYKQEKLYLGKMKIIH